MPVVEITDPGDERVRDYLRLTDVALRRVKEPAEGLYMAESAEVIGRALAAGHRPRSFLVEPKWLAQAEELSAPFPDVPVFVGTEEVLRAVTGFRMHRGALAAMTRPALPEPADLLAGARRVVVLEDVVDHTNVGAIFRSAAALGVDAVFVTPRCADPLYRRSVRVSMGTVFQVPWTRLDPWPGGLDLLHSAGFVTAAMALDDRSVTLDAFAADPPERVAVLMGTEGDGLSARAKSAADEVVRIPMLHGVDSLNVAAAAAVTFWALRVPAVRRAEAAGVPAQRP